MLRNKISSFRGIIDDLTRRIQTWEFEGFLAFTQQQQQHQQQHVEQERLQAHNLNHFYDSINGHHNSLINNIQANNVLVLPKVVAEAQVNHEKPGSFKEEEKSNENYVNRGFDKGSKVDLNQPVFDILGARNHKRN